MNSPRSFPRGVHPPDNKHFAHNVAIEVLPTPETVRIPLLQHLGAPCEAVVKAKDEVEVGTLLGKAGGFVSAAVHSSVKGTCAREGKANLPNGRRVVAIPIKAAEGQPLTGRELFDDVLGGDWPKTGLDAYSADKIVEACQAAGLVGMGGAAFPTHVKLKRNPQKPIDTLLINGAECEPYLTADYRLMLEAPAAIVCGVLLAQRATEAKDVFLCIEDNKPEAIASLTKAAEGTPIRIQPMKTKYPQGGEKQLIYAVTGRQSPTGGLPLDVGVVVMNVGTAAALARAVVRGKPLTHRVVTVAGPGIRTPKNILAPIGCDIQNLVDFCGGLTQEKVRVISGGPMMGFAVGSLQTVVTKGTSGITILREEDVRLAEETSCIRCGRCVDACPLSLVPTKLGLGARCNNVDVLNRYYINACMECGCCAYVCPAQIPLVQLIRIGKIQVKSAAAKAK